MNPIVLAIAGALLGATLEQGSGFLFGAALGATLGLALQARRRAADLDKQREQLAADLARARRDTAERWRAPSC